MLNGDCQERIPGVNVYTMQTGEGVTMLYKNSTDDKMYLETLDMSESEGIVVEGTDELVVNISVGPGES